jgi:D-beta-D-heptose 7-phosphate kinase/D-beta-D-heptose 1-phosphate adenosyltransferase
MKKVLVIGDTILDTYSYGEVERISPEAPVPVFDFKNEEYILGGAANVAANIRSLSLKSELLKIDYFGYYSHKIYDMFSKYNIDCVGIPIREEEILKKQRFVCNKHQIIRVDYNKKYQGDILYASFMKFKNLNFSEYDLIVVSDYDKNTLQDEEFALLGSLKNKKRLIDLKRVRKDMSSINFGKDTCVIKCNMKEYDQNPYIMMLGAKVVVTAGGNGYFFPETKESFPVAKKSGIIDVVGAGDTFLAGMAINSLESGAFDIYSMTKNGNLCASEKVSHFGTVAVDRSML